MQNLHLAEINEQQGQIVCRAVVLLQGYQKVKGTNQLLAPITPMRENMEKDISFCK